MKISLSCSFKNILLRLSVDNKDILWQLNELCVKFRYEGFVSCTSTLSAARKLQE